MENMNSTGGVLVCLRLHQQNSSSQIQIQDIVTKAVETCLHYADKILLCVNGCDGFMLELQYALMPYGDQVIVQHIIPWGNFTPALNAALQIAIDLDMQYILYQSTEVKTTRSKILKLMNCFIEDENVCAVGPMFDGHEFNEGKCLLRGRTCPWNTLCIWRVSYLALIGFPQIGNGYGSTIAGGVEEVSALAILMTIKPLCKVYLVQDKEKDDDTCWNTNFSQDAARHAYHDKKMASKDERPAEHLRLLGLASAEHYVHHVIL